MKRKSERRRPESRKKRCAAHSSEAEPKSDIYIGITGKIDCAMNPMNSGSLLVQYGDVQGGLYANDFAFFT